MGDVTLERETLYIMNSLSRDSGNKQQIAIIETRTQGQENDTPEQLIRYQFGSHLGSANIELDHLAKMICYEEYYPYGSTSYQAVRSDMEVPLNCYRYTGKESDEETRL